MTDNPIMPCRDITELCPTLERGAREFLKRCEAAGLKVLITQTYRSKEYQDSLYAQGRTAAGSIVTNCKGGQSPHNYRIAFDICKNVKGQEYSDNNFFKQCGAIWKAMGGVWGGDFKSLVDMPHFEFTDGKGYGPFKDGYKFFDGYRMPWEIEAEKIKKSEEDDKIMYVKYADIPDYAKPTIKKLMDKGLLVGNDKGELNLTESMVRLLVINDRAGLYK